MIGIVWNEVDVKWNMVIDHLKKYYKEFGNYDIPQNYISPDGYSLGEWFRSQKRRYKSGQLKNERIKELEDIGVQL